MFVTCASYSNALGYNNTLRASPELGSELRRRRLDCVCLCYRDGDSDDSQSGESPRMIR